MIRRSAAAVIVAALLACPLAIGSPVPAGSAPTVPAGDAPITWRTYRPPTEGRVLDPFRPPPEPWLPGNRGIEYATEPGSALLAIGPGRVAFAGQVGGRLVVSIVHPDGLRSSLTGVVAITVDVGATVWGGAPVAVAGERAHLGVRRAGAYLDPASLWGSVAGGGGVHLVPVVPADAAPPVGRADGSAPASRVGSPRPRHPLVEALRW